VDLLPFITANLARSFFQFPNRIRYVDNRLDVKMFGVRFG
jgi:hypothetical protein